MKKVILIFILMLLMLNLAPVLAAPENYEQKDVLIALLNPPISNAIVGFYGEPRLYDLVDAKIIEIKPILQPRGFIFRVVVEVVTFTGPHNPPYGRDKIDLHVDSSNVAVEKFEHKDL